MTIRVYVTSPDFLIDSLTISIVDRLADGAVVIYRPATEGQLGGTWESVPADGRETPPSFRLPYDAGRALLDALAHHYEGAEDTRRLRADYDAAGRRSDAQAAVIADVARTLAAKVGT